MAWATSEQLAAYMGIDEAELPATPEQVTRLLERATELLDAIVLGAYVPADAYPVVVERMARATCAQVEYWLGKPDVLDASDVLGAGGGIESYRAGSLSVNYATAMSSSGRPVAQRLAPRARDALFMAGMLNRAVAVRSGYGYYE